MPQREDIVRFFAIVSAPSRRGCDARPRASGRVGRRASERCRKRTLRASLPSLPTGNRAQGIRRPAARPRRRRGRRRIAEMASDRLQPRQAKGHAAPGAGESTRERAVEAPPPGRSPSRARRRRRAPAARSRAARGRRHGPGPARFASALAPTPDPNRKAPRRPADKGPVGGLNSAGGRAPGELGPPGGRSAGGRRAAQRVGAGPPKEPRGQRRSVKTRERETPPGAGAPRDGRRLTVGEVVAVPAPDGRRSNRARA